MHIVGIAFKLLQQPKRHKIICVLTTEPPNLLPHPAVLGKSVQQDLLQVFAGHSVVQVSHLDVCSI